MVRVERMEVFWEVEKPTCLFEIEGC